MVWLVDMRNALVEAVWSLTLLSAGSTWAGEWETAGGQHCIDRCGPYHSSDPYNWCLVSDPSGKYTSRGGANGFLDWSDTRPPYYLKWDYCVPSTIYKTNTTATGANKLNTKVAGTKAMIIDKGPVTVYNPWSPCEGTTT